MIDSRLLLNREYVQKLTEAGLAVLFEKALSLAAARRLAHWHGTNGTECYLWTLVLAAMRQMIGCYFEQRRFRAEHDAVVVNGQSRAFPSFDRLCRAFAEHYPRPDLITAESLESAAESVRRQLSCELFLLAVQLDNPTAVPWRPLFDDQQLAAAIDYLPLLGELETLLLTPQTEDPWQLPLGELLRTPLRFAPHSLADQLSYIRQHWGCWLSAELLDDLFLAQAVLAEEAALRGAGPGPSVGPGLPAADQDGPAAFSSDRDWMADCVLIAKSIYVWLDQLSRRRGCQLRTLSDIPDDELAKLAEFGFNALWLIGIWERSPGSKRIKQLAGNPEAEASAYALRAYRVADDLGGEAALDELVARCQTFGIRLACDVVPNHTGIDSELLFAHPDWFVQCSELPYPGYLFSGPDLSDRPEQSLRIEDGYWDHSDAAVVFEHVEQSSGRRRYIYHGNDGTHMPWNDTAQLNFLLPEVRRAMSDLIVAVARRFRLIRFDAAMTLARKHYRRLWFPPPGGSAGVPSRSQHWMSDADFDRAFPVEFWREVVDRINREVPDTLLIAEAFWLMESYFVRTLGMHRVYNSAFMNMLKREENAKYRRILKDTLAFNPEILKRYVNFMNNPDEATAVAQFGKGDKYFGVAVLLATLPGLPMFGHGQIEGLEEKYGMEYRRAYWDEEPDQGFLDHHWRMIFPLLHRRSLFSGIDNFNLYDFHNDSGVDENVYLFSNGPVGQRHLVLVNNSPHSTRGKVDRAVAKASSGQEGGGHSAPRLVEELGWQESDGGFCRFRDLCGSGEYLRRVQDLIEQGLDWTLTGYQAQVLCDFRIVDDPEGAWGELHDQLRGRPAANLDQALLRLRFGILWKAFVALIDGNRLRVLISEIELPKLLPPGAAALEQILSEAGELTQSLQSRIGSAPAANGQQERPGELTLKGLGLWLNQLKDSDLPGQLLYGQWSGCSDQPSLGGALLTWWQVERLYASCSFAFSDGCDAFLTHFGVDLAWREASASPVEQRDRQIALLLLRANGLTPHPALDDQSLARLISGADGRELLGIHQHGGTTWFNREAMAALCGALALQAGWREYQALAAKPSAKGGGSPYLEMLRRRLARAAAVGYRLDKFLLVE